MARFDVYRMPNNRRGYAVDMQADLLDHLTTRAVLPPLPLDVFQSPIRDLNPIFEIDGVRHVLGTICYLCVRTGHEKFGGPGGT
jgi:toxin CcdB